MKWCKYEKEDSNPFRWYGKFFHYTPCLVKSLKINSSDEKSRAVLIDHSIYRLWYSYHHLPEGYIGDLNEDLSLIDKTYYLINGFSNEMYKISFEKGLDEFKEIINNYLLWRKSEESDLENWGIKNKKRVSYDIPAYYYEK